VGAPNGAYSVYMHNLRGEAGELVPRLRGVFHMYSFWLALLASTLLAVFAASDRARIAATIYGFCLCALFAASGGYHRCPRPKWLPLLRRIDHSIIFLFIAGTMTPIALLVLPHSLRLSLLIVAWAFALLGIVFTIAWINAPRGIAAGVYILAGLSSGISLFAALTRLAPMPAALFIAGGLIYLFGAIVYALKRPNPWPDSFGFHEVFHALVCLAVGCQFVALAGWVIPLSA